MRWSYKYSFLNTLKAKAAVCLIHFSPDSRWNRCWSCFYNNKTKFKTFPQEKSFFFRRFLLTFLFYFACLSVSLRTKSQINSDHFYDFSNDENQMWDYCCSALHERLNCLQCCACFHLNGDFFFHSLPLSLLVHLQTFKLQVSVVSVCIITFVYLYLIVRDTHYSKMKTLGTGT